MTAAEEFAALFNRICTSLPKVTELTSTRRQKIKTRLKEHPHLDWWEDVFQKVQASPFLSGGEGWTGATLDWLITNDTNAVKVKEGQFKKRKHYLNGYD